LNIALPVNTDSNGNMPFALNMLITCSIQELVKGICKLDNELDAIMESEGTLSQAEQLEAITFNIADHDFLLETLLSRPLESDV
jgi:hypothetical protein